MSLTGTSLTPPVPQLRGEAVSVPAPVAKIDVSEAARRLAGEPGGDNETGASAAARGPLLVDVREQEEFATVRVPGAVLMPLTGFGETFAQLPRDRPLLLMCAAGRRSLVAAEHLARNGFTDVANVEGGITAWQRAGLPTRDGPPEPGEGSLERLG